MTDEKKPPQEAVGECVTKSIFPLRVSEHLMQRLYSLDAAFGVATRAAHDSEEFQLKAELEKRWDDYTALISAPLSRVPAKLFE